MRKELDEQLCAKYPEIFKDRHSDMRTTAMCWGFDCGDGWYGILDVLCSLIANDVQYNHMPPVTALQVKEKYGGLRFYFNGGNDRADAYSLFAESMSYRTCETCGQPGKPRKGGWIRTLCDEHAQEDGYNE